MRRKMTVMKRRSTTLGNGHSRNDSSTRNHRVEHMFTAKPLAMWDHDDLIRMARLRQFFSTHDSNSDGTLDVDELRLLLIELGENTNRFTHDAVSRMMKAVVPEGKLVIDTETFVEVLVLRTDWEQRVDAGGRIYWANDRKEISTFDTPARGTWCVALKGGEAWEKRGESKGGGYENLLTGKITHEKPEIVDAEELWTIVLQGIDKIFMETTSPRRSRKRIHDFNHVESVLYISCILTFIAGLLFDAGVDVSSPRYSSSSAIWTVLTVAVIYGSMSFTVYVLFTEVKASVMHYKTLVSSKRQAMRTMMQERFSKFSKKSYTSRGSDARDSDMTELRPMASAARESVNPLDLGGMDHHHSPMRELYHDDESGEEYFCHADQNISVWADDVGDYEGIDREALLLLAESIGLHAEGKNDRSSNDNVKVHVM